MIALSISAQSSVEKVGNKISDGIGTVHEDLTKATSTVYSDAADAVKTIYPDAKSTIQTVYGDAKKVVDYLTPRIEGALSSIATTLKTTVGQVWVILIKKQIAGAIANVIIFIVIIVFMFFYGSYCLKLSRREDFEFFESGPSTVLTMIIGGILCLLGLTFMGQNLQETIYGLYVPEYGALQEVTEITEKLLKAW